MKKIIVFLLLCNLFIPAYAQFKNIAGAAKRIRAGHLLPRPSVSRWSREANLALERRINQVPQTATATPISTALKKGHKTRSAFQVQYTDGPAQETASAFAINLNGKVWGVTAGHVMRNISLRPHMKVETASGTSITPIKKFFIGNPHGMDIALFEIPSTELAHLTILQPAKRAPLIGEKVAVSGFSRGQALSLSGEKVLFSTPLKLFIQKTFEQDLKGFCGSPIVADDGHVSAVYSGFADAPILRQFDWFNDLPWDTREAMSSLHYAIPIEVLELMAKGIEQNGSLLKSGTMMKVFHYPVALLHPNEYIISVEQFRNGEKIGKIHKNPLINPEKLEQFFELQENDILRVYVNRPQTVEVRDAYVGYDINVSTGEVTVLSERDLFPMQERIIQETIKGL